MSQGRFAQRGWAFQGFAFRPWGLAGAGEAIVTPGTQQRISIEATSKRRSGVELTSKHRQAIQVTSKRRLSVEL
jgi:hypothetical protein